MKCLSCLFIVDRVYQDNKDGVECIVDIVNEDQQFTIPVLALQVVHPAFPLQVGDRLRIDIEKIGVIGEDNTGA